LHTYVFPKRTRKRREITSEKIKIINVAIVTIPPNSSAVYQLPVATATHYYNLVSFNHRNVSSHHSGDQKSISIFPGPESK
jgi:hypothetical protein